MIPTLDQLRLVEFRRLPMRSLEHRWGATFDCGEWGIRVDIYRLSVAAAFQMALGSDPQLDEAVMVDALRKRIHAEITKEAQEQE